MGGRRGVVVWRRGGGREYGDVGSGGWEEEAEVLWCGEEGGGGRGRTAGVVTTRNTQPTVSSSDVSASPLQTRPKVTSPAPTRQ